MARIKDQDRFVPPVMHAFRAAFRERDSTENIDEKTGDGERIIAGRRSSPRSAVSDVALRQELADDLGTLLNTINMASAEDLTGLERVQKSILNFGVTDLTAVTSDSTDADDLARQLSIVLERFEQRLIPGSIQVKAQESKDDASGHIRFHVNADMYSTPVDVAVEFVADIEADSGKMKVTRV